MIRVYYHADDLASYTAPPEIRWPVYDANPYYLPLDVADVGELNGMRYQDGALVPNLAPEGDPDALYDVVWAGHSEAVDNDWGPGDYILIGYDGDGFRPHGAIFIPRNNVNPVDTDKITAPMVNRFAEYDYVTNQFRIYGVNITKILKR